MPGMMALLLVVGVLLVAATVVIGLFVALGRRHGFWSVTVPLLTVPAFAIALFYFPFTAPVVSAIFLVSAIASWSRRAHQWLPRFVAFSFAVGSMFLAGSHLRAVVAGTDDWNVEGILIVGLLLVSGFFFTAGVVEWGRWFARRVVWRGRYRDTGEATRAPLP